MPPVLRLRPLREEDGQAALAAHAAVRRHDDHDFLLGWSPETTWADHVERMRLAALGLGLPEGWVPSTFLGAFAGAGGGLVGRVSIRHQLNDWLAAWGGHVGYVVVPEARRRGHATEILRQAVVIARSLGVDDVLLTCDDANLASSRVIEACGGRLQDVRHGPERSVRRYWID